MDYLTIAYILIGVGLLLILAELVLPTGGILLGLAVCAVVGGVSMTFLYGDTSTGLITMGVVFIVGPILGRAVLRYWPKTRMGQRLVLAGPEDDATVATMPVNVELEQLRGRYGKTVSALRPAGVTEFDGKRIDTITEGLMVEPGQWVRCIDVKAGKVVVRPAEKPDLSTLESADFS